MKALHLAQFNIGRMRGRRSTDWSAFEPCPAS
jgi:hypothetical protein